MNARMIPVLIVSISLAMIGLIAIQIYWINNAVVLREGQFRQNVHDAMLDVAEHLERKEALDLMRGQDWGDQIFIQLDSMMREHQAVNAPNQQQNGNGFQFQMHTNGNGTDTIVDNQHVKIIVQESTSGEGETQTHVEQHVTAGESNNGIDIKFQLDASDIEEIEQGMQEILEFVPSNEVEKIRQKSINIGNLVNGIMELNFFRDINERVDINTIDSIMAIELNRRGIKTDYYLGVFDAWNNPVMLKGDDSPNFIKDVSTADYNVVLFPNDLMRDPNILKVHFPHERRYVISGMWFILSVSALLIIAIILAFSYTINTIFRQKKVSEIKNDFINNMTHELKTPIATISLACEALQDPDLKHSPDRVNSFVGMIHTENKRLGTLVENVLRTAVLDRGELKLNKEEVDLHQLIENAVKNIELQVHKKGGSISLDLAAEQALVHGDRVHLTNLVYNLLDNANKYTPEEPEIKITTRSEGNKTMVSVKDNGIGISRDHQAKIFDKLFRVPTGNIHNVKGFGLGLSYVKTIVDHHEGRVHVDSELGKGSTFTITLPQQPSSMIQS